MECVMSSRAILVTRSSLSREEILGASSFICSLESRRSNATLRAGSSWRGHGVASPTPAVNVIAPKRTESWRKVGESVVVASKVEGAVDILPENGESLVKLSRGQQQFFHRLPSGLRMEVISQSGVTAEGVQDSSSRAPLLFVHGSYHAAWCWAYLWLPYFAARGHNCYAVSLLGQGGSDVPLEKVSFSLQSHAGDLAHFIRHNLTERPVLIGHSFGGLIVQWFISHMTPAANDPPSTSTEGWGDLFPNVAAAALVCSTPPTGNGPMVKRFLKRDIVASIQITLSLAAKFFGSSVSLCRKSFFSLDMPKEDVQKYQKLLKQSSHYPMIDLQKLNDSLPLPRLPPQAPPVFVLAAENDFIVDPEGSQETADWYGTKPLVISGSGHDIMLDTPWEKAAEALLSWLDQQAF